MSSLLRPEPRLHRFVVIGVAISTALLLVLIVADFLTGRRLARLPLKDAVQIEVTGHMWWWGARYLDPEPSRMFDAANEFHVPVGRPVILKLASGDVIHSFWAPNLHGKKDLIPGRTSLLQFRVDKPGVYRGQCAEFCGLEHALMAFTVVAEPQAQFDAWAAHQRTEAPAPANPLALRGQRVFMDRTCVMCHTVAGTTAGARLGPDLTHLASWIVDPQRIKPGANMPGTPMPADDLTALVAYLETLK